MRFRIVALLRERESKTRANHKFHDIISIDNLLSAWREFLSGKRNRKDVAKFSLHFTDNILYLHRELSEKTYRHGPYRMFRINDPKPREIHKASVKDRLVHHAIYRVLYPYFDRLFIFDSFSCRRRKGVHHALNRFRQYGRQLSRNHTRTAWVLKCDIRKFFASIDHEILNSLLKRHLNDGETLWLLNEVINSFDTTNRPGVGLPLGNLTSQLLVNIYMNELDQFLKRQLRVQYCARYADDFVILHQNKKYLEKLLPKISSFLDSQLKLSLHPNKVSIQTMASGVDFLGWVHFPNHRVLRTATKRRVLKKIHKNPSKETLASYQGLLSHGNAHKLSRILRRNRV